MNKPHTFHTTTRRRFLGDLGNFAGLFAGAGAGVGLLGATSRAEASTKSEKPQNPQTEFPIADKEKGLTFLFQGDSITDGNWGKGGANSGRNHSDLNHYLGHGYVYAVSARLGADFPQAGFTFHNRGAGGEGILGLEKRWQKDAVDMKPDVLGILIGVNDVFAIARGRAGARDSASYEATYRKLLTRSREANPNVIFVLGVPFLYPSGHYGKINPEVSSREILKHADVVRSLAPQFNAVLVDYPAMFARATSRAPITHWIWDGCHPNAFGHEIMAREWIKQLATRLDFPKAYGY